MRVGGRVYSVTVANPAAGVNLSFRPPIGKIWELLSLCFTFTTSAQVANRCVGITYFNGSGSPMGLWRAGVVQVASLVKQYAAPAYAAGDPQATTTVVVPAPEGLRCGVEAAGRWGWGTGIHGIQTGDQISAVRALVEEWDI